MVRKIKDFVALAQSAASAYFTSVTESGAPNGILSFRPDWRFDHKKPISSGGSAFDCRLIVVLVLVYLPSVSKSGRPDCCRRLVIEVEAAVAELA